MDSSGDKSTGVQHAFILMLNPADTFLYCRLHHAASKAEVDSSAVFFLLMSCTADTVEIKPLLSYAHNNEKFEKIF